MKIRILGAHNLESRATRLPCILVDGNLALDAGGLTSCLSLDEQEHIRAILLTHHHYDHIRDIPALAINLAVKEKSVDIYCSVQTRNAVEAHLLNGEIYPAFQRIPENDPVVRFVEVIPLRPFTIRKYEVTAVLVNHISGAVGYQIKDNEGKEIFYTGDTGPWIAPEYKFLKPELLLTEVTLPDRFHETATEAHHLTPALLKEELLKFREIKGYIPSIVTLHMNPEHELEIGMELLAIAAELNVSITRGYEGMEVSE
jgi:Cft2 family RNA processing exonuclease